MTVRRLLLGSFLGLVVCLVAGQAFVANRAFREDLLSTTRVGLQREMELASLFLQTFSGPDLGEAAEALSQRLAYPVTLLTLEGQPVGTPGEVPLQAEGFPAYGDAPEIKGALEGEVGFDRRRGIGGGPDRLFAAARVALPNRDLVVHLAMPLDDLNRAVRRRTWQLLWLALPAAVLALTLTTLLGRALVRPLNAVTRRVRSASAGNFSRRLPTTFAAEEMKELAEAVNRIAEELGHRIPVLESERDEIQALIDCMGEAVVALTKGGKVLRANQAASDLLGLPRPVPFEPIGTLVTHPALRALLEENGARPFSAREVDFGDRNLMVSARSTDAGGVVVTFVDVTEIRRLETVRRDFVANASHELKTPLTAVRGFAETLMEDGVPEDLQKDWLRSIRSHTLRLQRLVDDLLDLSRLESGGWLARKEIVDVTVLAEDVILDFEQMARERDVSLKTEGAALAMADEQGLEQVLKNLVENAIRYTAEGGEIFLRLAERGENVEIAVQDNGNGIPPSALPRIFERFYRVDPARTREGGGTGLGLAIVRHLAHAMEGEVWAESEVGKGTTIRLRLPRVRTGGEEEGGLYEPTVGG